MPAASSTTARHRGRLPPPPHAAPPGHTKAGQRRRETPSYTGTHLQLRLPRRPLSSRQVLPAHEDAHEVRLRCDDLSGGAAWQHTTGQCRAVDKTKPVLSTARNDALGLPRSVLRPRAVCSQLAGEQHAPRPGGAAVAARRAIPRRPHPRRQRRTRSACVAGTRSDCTLAAAASIRGPAPAGRR